MVDVGGQWVHGEVDNISYELAWPLGLLEHSSPTRPVEFYCSSGPTIDKDTSTKLIEHFFNVESEPIPDEYLGRSIGEVYLPK